jgi:hypothetical protein
VGTNSEHHPEESTVATQVRRTKASAEKVDILNVFREHIVLKREGKALTTRAESLKARLKKWFEESPDDKVYANDTGSKFREFPVTISDGKKNYKGMEMRRSVSEVFNEEAAEAILKRKGVYEQALTPVLDQDKVYRLVQEKKITEKDLDKMLEQRESFAFWPMEGEVD